MRARLLAAALAAALGAIALAPAAGLATTHRPRPRALIFFNSLCLSCRADAAKIASWSRRERGRYAMRGVGFMMSTADSARFAHQMHWTFPVQGDPNGTLAQHCGVQVPTVIVLIDGRHTTKLNYATWR